MAYLIPETLHNINNVTPGEANLFRLFQQKLADDTYVWFNIPIRTRYPDFVILNINFGLLILEVKDWQLSQIAAVNPHEITLHTEQGEKRVNNPLQQAREYTLTITKILSADPILQQQSGHYKGQLILPFSYGVVWSRIKREDFQRELPELFDNNKMIFRDDLSSSMTAETLINRLQSLFTQRFSFQLSNIAIDRIRYHLFPEVRLPRRKYLSSKLNDIAQSTQMTLQLSLPGVTDLSIDSDRILTVMDLEQERLAKNLGEGHRLLRGVAGSGKTWTLICRARLLAQLHTQWKILVVCYNVSLATVLKEMLKQMELPQTAAQIEVINFHSLLNNMVHAARLNMNLKDYSAEEISQTLIKMIDENKYKPLLYDAILIDEAHDFHNEWLRLIVSCLNPVTNSLFIVHDSAQNIYRKGFSFKKVGVQIKGRTKVLRTNYRNTKEIADLASAFLSQGVKFTDTELLRDDEGQLLEIIRPQATLRSGPIPLMVQCETYREECAETAARVKLWLEKGEFPAQEILILYVKRGPKKDDDRYIEAILNSLTEAGVAYEWITKDQQSKREFQLSSPKVKVSTIHSAKGLDFAAVAMVGIALLPASDQEIDQDRKLIYVGLTRARKYLLITYCKETQFILELKACLKNISS